MVALEEAAISVLAVMSPSLKRDCPLCLAGVFGHLPLRMGGKQSVACRGLKATTYSHSRDSAIYACLIAGNGL